MTATEQILEERKGTHGSFADNARVSQCLKQVLHNERSFYVSLSHSQQEALDMICCKISRILSGNADEPDHWQDIAGYATLVVKELASD